MARAAMHTTAQPGALRRLDELVIEALAVAQPHTVRNSDTYLTIEIVDDADDDVAVTHRFVRSPYETIEIGAASSSTQMRRARPTTFVKTVRVPPPQPAATLAFDKQWFEQDDDVIAAIEDVPRASTTSWLWLGISLLAAAFAVGIVQYAL
jgi:hypothetical protein